MQSIELGSMAGTSEIPNLDKLRAACFLLDAEEYRSIEHKLDLRSLAIYRFVHSRTWKFLVFFVILSLHCLAFLENPSSLSLSSLVHTNGFNIKGADVPQAILFCFEAFFLSIVFIDTIFQTYITGIKNSLHCPWIIAFFLAMTLSWIDFFVNVYFGTKYLVRARRFVRPIFAMQKSQLMKKVLKSLRKSSGDISSACFLLFLWLFGFTVLSLSRFSGSKKVDNSSAPDKNYSSFYNAFFTLLVLLTTANNPDAMVEQYNKDRLSFIFFLIFTMIGTFVFMNLLIAIVFNEFRGHILDSMQTSILRRRIACRAMFEVLKLGPTSDSSSCGSFVNSDTLSSVIKTANIPVWHKTQMQRIIDSIGTNLVDWDAVKLILSPMDDIKEPNRDLRIPKLDNKILKICQMIILSKAFEVGGLVVCVFNVIMIASQLSLQNTGASLSTSFEMSGWFFICLYVVEQAAKLAVMGHRIYFSHQGCIFDFGITVAILIMKILGDFLSDPDLLPYHKYTTFAILSDIHSWAPFPVMMRAVKIVLLIPSSASIVDTLNDLPRSLASVIGLLVLVFYLYALLGMALFMDKITPTFMARNVTDCGSYQQLNYGGIHFNDFYSSIVTLWCLLIVNNWHVFMIAFADAVDNRLVHLYMISFWLIAVIVVLSCVTAFIIEGYAQRKAYNESMRVHQMRPLIVNEEFSEPFPFFRRRVTVDNTFTFQMLFKNDVIEPNEEELTCELRRCEYLCELYPDISLSQSCR